MSSVWPTVQLGGVLKHRKEFIEIDELTAYTRPRVKLHAQGIVQRDRVLGAEIKTKRQQVCRAGEFLVAEIDAKVGGFGLVPDELDGAIVSSHYFLFQIDETKCDRRFLDFYSRTRGFREQVEAQGSTNYAAIRPADVLGYRVPLPPLQEQRRIVARIEAIAGKIEEARRLRGEAEEEAAALVVSLHLKLAGTRTKALGEILDLDEDAVPIESGGAYPQVGVRSFGAGLFKKGPTMGSETTYRAFNRLYAGAVVLSQVKGWEGAISVATADLKGWYVSPEYKTFRCRPSEAVPNYLAALLPTEWFWSRLGAATRGVGARRERTRPEQFLRLRIPMPDVAAQEVAVRTLGHLGALRAPQNEIARELDAVVPAVLDRAFRGEM